MTENFGAYILTAFALVFVIEGLLYALFPEQIRKMMALAISLPPEKLRNFGLMMAAAGLCSLWILGKFQSH